jgi:hypothetical protein
MAQKAALGQKIKDIVAVDQRGMTRMVGPMPLQPVTSSCVVPRRHTTRREAMTAEGMAAVGFEPG